MLLYTARTNDRGFTMLEITVVLMILGILAAIAVPSFLSMLNKSKVSDALAQVRGALQEAQREAIRKSMTCTVTVPKGNNQTISSTCFVTGDRTLTDINIDYTNTAPWTITFDYKGRTNDVNSSGTIKLTSINGNTNEIKCLVISQGLGIIRTGNYTGTNCESSR
jgi:prepilin-type N-terminal cleavage/methylation domain-containing protein